MESKWINRGREEILYSLRNISQAPAFTCCVQCHYVLHSYGVFSVRKIGRATEQNSKIAGGKIGHFWRRVGIKAYWASQLVLSCALGVEKSETACNSVTD